MRRLQLWIVLLTLLTLPGYGLAGLAHVRSCQLQMTSAQAVATPGDCCPGKWDSGTPCKRLGDDPGKNGTCTPCKAGYNCKTLQPCEPNALRVLLVVPARPLLTVHSPTLLVSHSTNGLWRPPRLI